MKPALETFNMCCLFQVLRPASQRRNRDSGAQPPLSGSTAKRAKPVLKLRPAGSMTPLEAQESSAHPGLNRVKLRTLRGGTGKWQWGRLEQVGQALWGRRHCSYYSHMRASYLQPGHGVLEGQPTPQPGHTATLAHWAQNWTHSLARPPQLLSQRGL